MANMSVLYQLTGSFMGNSYSNLSTSMTALNPIIGNTATSHSKDYVTLGTATFTGSPTQNDGAVALNGTSQYMTSDYNSSGLGQNSRHMTFVSSTARVSCACGEMGAGTVTAGDVMRINFTGSTGYYGMAVNPTTGSITEAGTTLAGVTTVSRAVSNQMLIYFNGAALGSQPVASSSSTVPSGAFTIGALDASYSGRFSTSTITGYSIGTSVSTAQITSEYNFWTRIGGLK